MRPVPASSANRGDVQLGFKTSIIALFVAIVLVIGLTLVYLSFQRITAVTDAGSQQVHRQGGRIVGGPDRLAVEAGAGQSRNIECAAVGPVRRRSRIIRGCIALLAAMLKSNDQLFSLYVGYDDGSFIEMDDIDGTGRETRARLEAPEQAAFRLVVISRSDPARVKSRRLFLSDKLETIRELPGPLDYDPRERPWYKDADRRDGSWLTGPYVFFATGKQGYTVQSALKQGRGGVIAGDLLLDVTQEVLKREKLTASGVAFLFDDDDRILAHPRMSEMLGREVSGTIPRLRETDMAGVLQAIRAWRVDGIPSSSSRIRRAGSMRRLSRPSPRSGPANLRVAVVAPVDEFFASILSERGRLFAATLGFVAAHGSDRVFHRLAAVQIAAGARRGDRPDSEIRALGGTAGAFRHPRDRRTRPLGFHHAHHDGNLLALRAAAAGGAADRRPGRRCNSVERDGKSRCCSPTSSTSRRSRRRPTRRR